jgi:hypothetical protein
MPITTCDCLIMANKSIFVFGCCKIPNYCFSIIWTRHKFNWTQWKRQVSHLTLTMGLELIHLVNHLIAINNCSFIVTCHQEFLIVAPTHCLNLLTIMHITTILKLKMLCIPHNNLSWTWASSNFFAVFHPFDLVQRPTMLIDTLPQIVCTCNLCPIRVCSLATRIVLRSI